MVFAETGQMNESMSYVYGRSSEVSMYTANATTYFLWYINGLENIITTI